MVGSFFGLVRCLLLWNRVSPAVHHGKAYHPKAAQLKTVEATAAPVNHLPYCKSARQELTGKEGGWGLESGDWLQGNHHSYG